jgi:hypothetical protein
MKITSKNTKKILYKAVFYTLSATALFCICWKISSIFSYVLFIAAVLMLLKGYLCFFDIRECKEKEHIVKIENDTLYVDNETLTLKNKNLFLDVRKCGELFKIFLYENERKPKLIFKAVLDEKEYIEILKLIKQYKKLPLYLEKTDGIFICKIGFAVDGKEFCFDELSSVEWEVKTYRCRFGVCSRYILVRFILKDGNLITTEVEEKDLNYAKLLYIRGVLEGDMPENRYIDRLIEKLNKDECEDLV